MIIGIIGSILLGIILMFSGMLTLIAAVITELFLYVLAAIIIAVIIICILYLIAEFLY